MPQSISLVLLLSLTAGLQAGFLTKKVSYSDDLTSYEGILVYDESLKEPAPAILLVPNWMGVTESAIEKAKSVAGTTRIVFVADMYGLGQRPNNSEEAGAAAAAVRSDRPLMRARAQLALDTLLQQGVPLDREKTAAIGFCFGGGTVLELGRSGAALDAIVSFHGDLLSPTLAEDAAQTKARLLVLHGANDPFVPQEDVAQFQQVMASTEVDWQLIQFSNTVHSFTDPTAQMAGKAEYYELSSNRAFAYFEQFVNSVWSR